MKNLLKVLFVTTAISTTSVSAEPNDSVVVLTTKYGHKVTIPIGKDGYIPKMLEDGAIRINEGWVLLPTGKLDKNGNVLFVTMPYAAYAAQKAEISKEGS
jgi:hypothetical protein